MDSFRRALALIAPALLAAPLAAQRPPAPADTARARVDLRIGEGQQVDHVFGKVSGVALDAEGRLYVADFLEAQVAVFGADGRLRARVGRKGKGPGEFDAPTGPTIAPDGALYVRDMSEVKHFAVDPATGVASRWRGKFAGPPMAPWTSLRQSRVDRRGRFHFPDQVWRAQPRDTTWHFYLVYGADGRLADTLPVPDYRRTSTPTASIRTSPNGGRMVAGLNRVPFAPEPVFEVTGDGTVISGDARSYLLVETDASGRELRRFGRQVPATRIPAAERRDSLQALRTRLDTLPVGLDRLSGVPDDVKALRLPDVLPAYVGLTLAADGAVWVRRWAPAGREVTVFDVFDAQRRFRGTVELPVRLAMEPAPVVRGDAIVGVVLDPETDLPIVVRARVRQP